MLGVGRGECDAHDIGEHFIALQITTIKPAEIVRVVDSAHHVINPIAGPD